jgi:hypothetical protein
MRLPSGSVTCNRLSLSIFAPRFVNSARAAARSATRKVTLRNPGASGPASASRGRWPGGAENFTRPAPVAKRYIFMLNGGGRLHGSNSCKPSVSP